MLSLYLKPEIVASYIGRLSAVEKRVYRDAFDAGEVEVIYRFRDGKVSYLACHGEEYGEFSVSISGKVEIHPSNLSYMLLEFVRSFDESSDEEALRRAYGNDYDALAVYAKLGPRKAKAYLEASARIDELVAKIEGGKKTAEQAKPNLRFCIQTSRGRNEVFLRVGFDKLYVNRRVGAFIREYYSGNPLNLQKKYVSLPKNAFNPDTEAALQFLYNHLLRRYYFDENYPVALTDDELLDFLFLIKGQHVELEGRVVPVYEPVEVRLVMDASGKLVTIPAISAKDVVQKGRFAYRRDPDSIYLFTFASEAAGELFGFYASLGGIDGSFVADHMAKRVLPLLEDTDVAIDEAFSKDHPIIRPRIAFYVGLENEKRLSFETKYFLGPNEVASDEFCANAPHCQSRRDDFLREVANLGFVESGFQDSDDAIVRFLLADLTILQTCCDVFISEELQRKRVLHTPCMELRTSSGEDWFSLTLQSDDYDPAELKAIYAAFVKKKKYVKLRGNYVVIDEENEQLKTLAESFDPEQIGIELPLYQALKVPSVTGDPDEKIKEMIENVENYGNIDVSPLPEEIANAMRPYQKTGIQFLANLYVMGLSGVLSDDMGLGKTLQSFGLLSLIDDDRPILIVCPKSLVYNWMAERDKWYPALNAFVLTGSPSERKKLYAGMASGGKACYFVSYDTLRNDINLVKDVEFSCVLLDEGQYISNATAQKTRAVKLIKADSRFVLTGTPVQNSLLDLWSIFDFLLPGYFPPLKKFKELYGALEVSSEEARKRLLAKVKPFLLGRKKKDVLTELPDKENITISLSLDQRQREVYEAHLAKAREMMEDPTVGKLNILAMMTRLRQICVTPSLFLEGDFPSEKIDYLIDALLDLKKAGRKAIVFSSFVGALSLISARCDEAGLIYEKITGDTSAKVRVILAERFNAPGSSLDVMLVSLKAGGTGLNLIGADTVFHLDPWWNLAAERQAEDRAHRIGQKEKVTVFKLVAKDTVEEKVVSLQEKKGLLIDLADEASLENALTDEDYRFLLS